MSIWFLRSGSGRNRERTSLAHLFGFRLAKVVNLHDTLHPLAVIALVLRPEVLSRLHVGGVVLVDECVAHNDHVLRTLANAAIEPFANFCCCCHAHRSPTQRTHCPTASA